MKKNLIGLVLGLGLILAVSSDAFAQGRGRGGGGGNGNGRGNSGSVNRGNSGNVNVNRSKNDRKDTVKNDRVNNSNNRYNGLSRKTGMSSVSLQKWYESQRALNPNLTYGQFVAANMIARNHPGISAQTILDGLGSGRSIGQVLHGQGWNESRIKSERKRIKKNVKDDGLIDYTDRDKDWKF